MVLFTIAFGVFILSLFLNTKRANDNNEFEKLMQSDIDDLSAPQLELLLKREKNTMLK